MGAIALKKNSFDIAAAIDVGTNHLKMSIAQMNADGSILILDEVSKPTSIGSDVFTYGRINTQAIKDTVQTIKGFKRLLIEYQVKHYKAIATSAFREAENQEYVLERVRINTDITIEVINSAQERYYMYKALRYEYPNLGLDDADESVLVANIASGGLEFSIYRQGSLTMTEYINIGALRLHESLSDLQNKTIEFSRVMEEFIYSKLSPVKSIISKANIKYFVGLGTELNAIFTLFNNKNNYIRKADVTKLYEKIRLMKSEEISTIYHLSEKQVETLLPSVIILNLFLKMTHIEKIYIPMLELHRGMILDIADWRFDLLRQRNFDEDIISSVWYIGKKYGIDRHHSSNVAKLALLIFDKTAKIHKLNRKYRLYLQIAAILHPIGYYVNFNNYNIIASWLIQKQNIMGFSNKELEIIASIVRYHETEVPQVYHSSYQNLTHEEKVIVSKLSAILKLANSLDSSHEGKIKNIEIIHKKGELYFDLNTNYNTVLEEWMFAQRADFFEEVMGLRPMIKK